MTASRACIDSPCSLSLIRELGCHNDGCRLSIIKHNIICIKVMDLGQAGLVAPNLAELVK